MANAVSWDEISADAGPDSTLGPVKHMYCLTRTTRCINLTARAYSVSQWRGRIALSRTRKNQAGSNLYEVRVMHLHGLEETGAGNLSPVTDTTITKPKDAQPLFDSIFTLLGFISQRHQPWTSIWRIIPSNGLRQVEKSGVVPSQTTHEGAAQLVSA